MANLFMGHFVIITNKDGGHYGKESRIKSINRCWWTLIDDGFPRVRSGDVVILLKGDDDEKIRKLEELEKHDGRRKHKSGKDNCAVPTVVERDGDKLFEISLNADGVIGWAEPSD